MQIDNSGPGATHFEDRFCASKKSGTEEVERFRHKVPCTCMAAALGCENFVWEQALQEMFYLHAYFITACSW